MYYITLKKVLISELISDQSYGQLKSLYKSITYPLKLWVYNHISGYQQVIHRSKQLDRSQLEVI